MSNTNENIPDKKDAVQTEVEVPKTTIEQSNPEAIPAEPPPPFWFSRKYVGRAFGFTWNGVFIEGSFYDMGSNRLGADGLYGKTEYQSLDDLVNMADGTQEEKQALISKITSLFTS